MSALLLAVVFASAAATAQIPPKPAAPAPAPAPAGQKPAPAPQSPAAPAPATPPSGAQQAPGAKGTEEPYTYDPDNRRDPFVSLIGTGIETNASAKRGEGAAGMLVAEVSVRGIMQSRGALVAVVEAPDKKTYIVHQGDRFADGTIKSITPTGLIIIQDVNDPLSLVKQREVRKLLRSLEDAKE